MKTAQIASTIALSAVKHTFGGLPMAATFGFSYLEVAGFTAIGGLLGVMVFLFLYDGIRTLRMKYLPAKRKPKIFSKRTRFIIRIKRTFGLAGIAFLTPAVLSVPIGTVVAKSMYRDRAKVFVYLAVSVLFWSFAGAAVVHPVAKWLGA